MTPTDRVELQPAWILHHYPYRDSSLLLEVLVQDHGRVGLVARGARGMRSRWRNRLQIMRPLLLSWTQRGELGTLTCVEERGFPSQAAGRQVLCVCYMNELLMRLQRRNDAHPGLFMAYEKALHGLPLHEEQALRCFEKQLLQELGYGLLLDHEVDSGEPVHGDADYEYRLERGPVRVTRRSSSGIYLRGSSLLALQREVLLDRDACREAKRLTRAALSLYLGDRPLKSRQVLQQLSGFSRAAGTSGRQQDGPERNRSE